MKALRQFVLTLAVVLPLLAPTMACALPSAHLTPAEQACCKQMKGHCGNMEMPAAHGCCLKDVPTANQWNVAQLLPVHDQIAVSPTADLVSVVLQTPADLQGQMTQPRYTLPQSPPAAISVLRI